MTSPVKSVLIDEATPDQQRQFATTFLNLALDDNASEADVRAAIERAQPGSPLIFVLEEPNAEEKAQAEALDETIAEAQAVDSGEHAPRMQGTLGRGDPRFTINIPVQDNGKDKSGQRDVPVSVNGRIWQIKRGVDATIPARVFEALQNSVGVSINHDHMPDGSVEETRSEFKRIPFQIVERPSEAAMKAWHEATDELLMA